jgi:hypothetical protein
MKLITIATVFFALQQLTAARNLRPQHRDLSADEPSSPQNNLRAPQVHHHDIPTTELDFPALRGSSPIGLHLPDPCECECSLSGKVGIIHVDISGKNNVVEQEIQCVTPDLSSWAIRTKRYECVHCGESECIDCD